MNRKISFIIPVYNGQRFIRDSVESIINGNLENGDEIIIVDDFSTDDSLNVISELVKKNAMIRLIKNRVNKGSASAGRNTAIESSDNELFFCLDQDNCLESGSIKLLKKYMIDNNADSAAFQSLCYFKKDISDVTHKWIFNSGLINFADALAGHYWPGPSGNYMFTRESWERAGRYYEPAFLGGMVDSWIFGIRQLATGTKMVVLPDSFYYHRYGHESQFITESRKGNISLSALIGLLPFINLIEDKDVEYIFSKRYRKSWFDNLEQKPLKLIDSEIGKTGTVIFLKKDDDENNSMQGIFKKKLLKLFTKKE